MGEADVKIVVLYSDHDHHLILFVDDVAKRPWFPERGCWNGPPRQQGYD